MGVLPHPTAKLEEVSEQEVVESLYWRRNGRGVGNEARRPEGEEGILRARKRSSDSMATALTKRIETFMREKGQRVVPELRLGAHRRIACRGRKAAS